MVVFAQVMAIGPNEFALPREIRDKYRLEVWSPFLKFLIVFKIGHQRITQIAFSKFSELLKRTQDHKMWPYMLDFHRTVSKDFVKRLTDNGYRVTLNKKNVITSVESNDKTFSRSSAHTE
ncbi:hypothetical protein B9Z55_021883 [Caenorhabditis nigoni]|nr:hypothetical protein B9Z55_021883 [Caenorhabditis nigoni]